MKKIFTACLGTETNTFASIPTGHGLFEETCLFRKGSYGKNVPMFGAPLAVWKQRGEAKAADPAAGAWLQSRCSRIT